MHDELEKKIYEIINNLDDELLQAHAIDKNNNALDVNAFNRILDKKIKELHALEPLVADEMGIVTDRYGAKILFHHISVLQDKKDRNTANTADYLYDHKKITAVKKTTDTAKELPLTQTEHVSKLSKTSLFIKKAFQKIVSNEGHSI